MNAPLPLGGATGLPLSGVISSGSKVPNRGGPVPRPSVTSVPLDVLHRSMAARGRCLLISASGWRSGRRRRWHVMMGRWPWYRRRPCCPAATAAGARSVRGRVCRRVVVRVGHLSCDMTANSFVRVNIYLYPCWRYQSTFLKLIN